MNKMMMIGSALLVLSSSAFATEARLLALGMNETDNEGMYYIQDGRNIFLNSANVNNYADQLVTEYGSNGLDVTATVPGNGSATVDQNHRPKAQGGVFKKYGGLVYGLYYGNESNTSSLLRIAATQQTGLATPIPTADNQIDLFVGGDAGLKWGANVTYAHNKNEVVPSKETAIATRLGVMGSNWDAHLNLSLKSDSETAFTGGTQEFDGKIGFQAGGSYAIDKNRIFGYVKHYGWDQKATGVSTIEGDFSSYYIGWGRDFDVNNGDKIFTALTAKKTDINLKYATKAEVRHLIIPLNIGYEAKATEWLTIRGSVVQNIYGKKDNKRVTGTFGTDRDLNTVASNLISAIYGANGKTTIANSTEVNAGATLTFGQLTVDGLLGLTGSNRGTGSTGLASPNKNQGLLAWDNLESRVGVTYKF
ncbi:MAG: hypothetical protein ACXVLQ_04005 [Bacteriovorax sp.]